MKNRNVVEIYDFTFTYRHPFFNKQAYRTSTHAFCFSSDIALFVASGFFEGICDSGTFVWKWRFKNSKLWLRSKHMKRNHISVYPQFGIANGKKKSIGS